VADYSIWVSEYAVAPEFPETYVVHGQPGTRELPFTISVVEGGGHTILVDTGFSTGNEGGQSLADLDGITVWIHPTEALARIGFSPEEIDIVVITHGHYDHMGTVGDFPNATCYVQAREINKWIWAASLPAELAWLRIGLNSSDLRAAVDLAARGTLRLVDGSVRDLVPGVSLVAEHDSHTYGHQHVEVECASSGSWILPGDVVYSYINLEGLNGDGEMVPIGFATSSQENCLLAMSQMMTVVDGQTTRIVPGHEVRIWERYPSRAFDDGLHIAEVTLAPGARSRL
jgi:N-acyl homoserine lactone hydrolase